MTQHASDPADEIRAPSEADTAIDSNAPNVDPSKDDGSPGNGNRTADDPFDRKRLERLSAIADPAHPETDPLADVDTAVVSPGDGGTTGPDDVIDLDWDIDLTLDEDVAPESPPPAPPTPPAIANDPRESPEADTEVG